MQQVYNQVVGKEPIEMAVDAEAVFWGARLSNPTIHRVHKHEHNVAITAALTYAEKIVASFALQ